VHAEANDQVKVSTNVAYCSFLAGVLPARVVCPGVSALADAARLPAVNGDVVFADYDAIDFVAH
jgi:hypothetical protein